MPNKFASRLVVFSAVIFMALTAASSRATDDEPAWVYEQSTGKIWLGGKVLAQGYSGHGDGVNNPDKEKIKNAGPIPRGEWTIGEPFKHETKGPVVMRLSPDGHQAHGRDGFLIHGDNKEMNRSASEGCIILGPDARQAIAKSGVKKLRVVR